MKNMRQMTLFDNPFCVTHVEHDSFCNANFCMYVTLYTHDFKKNKEESDFSEHDRNCITQVVFLLSFIFIFD